jgi:hypothetical protein
MTAPDATMEDTRSEHAGHVYTLEARVGPLCTCGDWSCPAMSVADAQCVNIESWSPYPDDWSDERIDRAMFAEFLCDIENCEDYETRCAASRLNELGGGAATVIFVQDGCNLTRVGPIYPSVTAANAALGHLAAGSAAGFSAQLVPDTNSVVTGALAVTIDRLDSSPSINLKYILGYADEHYDN